MKRIFLMLALVALLGGVLVPAASAQENKHIPVFIDGLPVNFDVQPVIQNGRTLVPFKTIAETRSSKPWRQL